jgi:hypothetical protein
MTDVAQIILGYGVMGLIALDAFAIEPQWLQVSVFEITSDKIEAPPGLGSSVARRWW